MVRPRFPERRARVWFGPLVACALSTACNEYGYTQVTHLDVFRQERRNAVDLLVVIDNSCSMVEEQDNLASNFDTLIERFAEADVDWQIGVTTTDVESERFRGLLMGGDDEIVLRGPSGEIDRVRYDRSWLFEEGVSLALDGNKMRLTYNDGVANWCASTSTYAEGYRGTPGTWNPSCDGAVLEVPSLGADEGPRAPVAGDLVISEILAKALQQQGDLDSTCEWFEITNVSSDTLELDALVIRDDGRNYIGPPREGELVSPPAFSSGTTLAPHGALVVGRSDEGACGQGTDVVFPSGFSLNDDVRVLTRDTPDGRELFAEQVAQGTGGSGIEMGLEASRLVFTEPYLTESNGGFLRQDANLSVLFVSDEDDLSPYPVDAYVRALTNLKGDVGYRDRSLINLSAVVAKDPPAREDLPSCTNDNGTGWYGRRYIEAANETQGLVDSICEEDFAPIVSRLGLTLSGLELEFELSRWPRLETLRVELYASDADDSFVRELALDEDFTYEAEGNLLRFVEDQVPPSEYYITAEYVVLPTGLEPEGASSEAAR